MKKNIIILGAGPTGLSVAWKLALSKNFNIKIIEKNNYTGGLCASLKYKDFIVDYGPHKISPQFKYIQEEIENLLTNKLIKVPKVSSIYYKNNFFEYPFKIKNLLFNFQIKDFFNLGFSYVLNYFIKPFNRKKIISYEDYVIDKFGKPIYESIFKGQAEKIWGEPNKLSKELAQVRINILGPKTILSKILNIFFLSNISNTHFFYPKYGIGQLCNEMEKIVEDNDGKIIKNAIVKNFKIVEGKITEITIEKDNSEETLLCDFCVSTIPITKLVSLIYGELKDKEIIENSKKLLYRNLMLFYIIVNRRYVTRNCWIFFPEKKYLFNRIFEQKNFNKDMLPEDKTIICCDLTCLTNDNIWNMNDNKIFEILIEQLESINLITRGDVTEYFSVRIENVYPIYSLNFEYNLNAILNKLDKIPNLISLGRLGLFNYSNIDHCIDMGITASKYIISGMYESKLWSKEREKFNQYRIKD